MFLLTEAVVSSGRVEKSPHEQEIKFFAKVSVFLLLSPGGLRRWLVADVCRAGNKQSSLVCNEYLRGLVLDPAASG